MLAVIVAMATVAGCTAGLDGTPYGAAADSTDGHPSTPQSSPLDAGTRAAHWSASPSSDTDTTNATSDAGPYTLPDSGLGAPSSGGADASTAVVATSSVPNCSASAGLACEDCCFAGIPGANALNNSIDAEYNDCVDANGCFDADCYNFCNDQAMNDQCSAQPTLCHLIDNCMAANRCP